MSADTLRAHLDYSAWASAALVEAAAQLTPEELNRDFQTSDRTILGTLAHVFAADRLWLARLTRTPVPTFIQEVDYRMAALQTEWPEVMARWKNWAAALTDQSALDSLAYTDLSGRPWNQPVWKLVLHVVNHGTHHRGQVSGFLRSLGRKPPVLDLVHYYRQAT